MIRNSTMNQLGSTPMRIPNTRASLIEPPPNTHFIVAHEVRRSGEFADPLHDQVGAEAHAYDDPHSPLMGLHEHAKPPKRRGSSLRSHGVEGDRHLDGDQHDQDE